MQYTPTRLDLQEFKMNFTGSSFHTWIGCSELSYSPKEDSWLFVSRYFYPETKDDVLLLFKLFSKKHKNATPQKKAQLSRTLESSPSKNGV